MPEKIVEAKDVFEKTFNKSVNKFKLAHPEDRKTNYGGGNLSIAMADIKGSKMCRLVFRNSIGKVLYDGIIHKKSKSKEITEKAFKNQLKVLVFGKTKPTDPKE